MNIKNTNHNSKRMTILTKEYSEALLELTLVTPIIVRNLVLDIYASEREFIREFQQYIDPRLEKATAKYWDFAIKTLDKSIYINNSRKVIKAFQNEMISRNELIATQIMQCIGQWKGFSENIEWANQIAEHTNNQTQSPSAKAYSPTQRLAIEYISEDKEKLHTVSSQSNSTQNSIENKSVPGTSHSQSAPPFALNNPRGKRSTSSGWDVVVICTVFILLPILGIANIMIINSGNNLPKINSSESNNKLNELENRSTKANLICEYNPIIEEAKTLSVSGSANIARKDAIVRRAKEKISYLNQPAKYKYVEDSNCSYGFQWFDQPNFAGEPRAFIVTSKRCTSPVLHYVQSYDKSFSKIAAKSSINLVGKVPGEITLPSLLNGQSWFRISKVSC